MTKAEATELLIDICESDEHEFGPSTVDGRKVSGQELALLLLAAFGVGDRELKELRPWQLGPLEET